MTESPRRGYTLYQIEPAHPRSFFTIHALHLRSGVRAIDVVRVARPLTLDKAALFERGLMKAIALLQQLDALQVERVLPQDGNANPWRDLALRSED